MMSIATTAKEEDTPMSALKTLWSDDANLVRGGLAKLGDMCSKGAKEDVENNRKEICRQAGPLIIVKTMDRHGGDPVILAQGCRALATVVYNNPDGRGMIAEVGGIPAVLEAMKKFPDDGNVQRFGCGALCNFTTGCQENKQSVVDADGIAVIVSAMKRHPKNSMLQRSACMTHENLGTHCEETLNAVIAADGLKAIVETAENNLDSPEVKYHVGKALITFGKLIQG